MRIPQLRPILYSATHRPSSATAATECQVAHWTQEMCRFISGNLGAFQSSAPLDLNGREEKSMSVEVESSAIKELKE